MVKKVDRAVKKKEQEAKLKVELMKQAEMAGVAVYPYNAEVKLSEYQQQVVVDDIETYISNIDSKRTERGLYKKWRKARDQYEGVVMPKDFPWANCSNLHIHITAMTCDILLVKAESQMYVSPMMILKPLPYQDSDDKMLYENVQLKESFLDYKVRDEIGIEVASRPAFQDAICLGTGWRKLTYVRKIDNGVPVLEVFDTAGKDEDSTAMEISRFESYFESEKGTPQYAYYMSALKVDGGNVVDVWSYQDVTKYDNPKIKHVQLENLYVDPDIIDIENQRIVAEEMTWSWSDLLVMSGNGFSKTVIEGLKDKYADDYDTRDYPGVEAIYLLPGKKLNAAKIQIAYLQETKEILRTVSYPCMHRECYYIPSYIDKSARSIYGRGMAEKLEATNKALNTFWNQTVDAGTIANAPTLEVVDGSKLDPSSKAWEPLATWYVKQKNSVNVISAKGDPAAMLNLIARLERYAEWITGVTAYMTGRESPLDPNAPMGKAYMLLKESNLRINNMIKSLHDSNVAVFRQSDSMIYQYSRGNRLPYSVMQGQEFSSKSINRKVLALKVQYIPQLSDIVVNKELEKETNMKFGAYLMTLPFVQRKPGALQTITEIQIRGMGGVWEKKMAQIMDVYKEPLKGVDTPKTPEQLMAAAMEKSIAPAGPENAGNMGEPLPLPGAEAGVPAAGVPAEMIPR